MPQINTKTPDKQIQNVESTSFTRKKSTNLNVRINPDLSIDKPWQGGKSQTAQGERSVTLGIEYWITLLYDSLRVEDVPQELDSSWRQWRFREIIALTNMSFRTGTPYPPMPVLGNVVRCLIPRVLADASPWAVLCRAVGTNSRFISAYSDVEFFSCINPRVFKIEKA